MVLWTTSEEAAVFETSMIYLQHGGTATQTKVSQTFQDFDPKLPTDSQL